MFFFSGPVSFDMFPVSTLLGTFTCAMSGMQSKSCHNICHPSGLISSASWCKQGLLHSSMLVEVHSLEPIHLSHYVYFAKHRNEIPNHLVASFPFFHRASYIPAHFLMELLMMTICGGFCCKMSRFPVSDMEICCIFAGLNGCRSMNGCHLTPSFYDY